MKEINSAVMSVTLVLLFFCLIFIISIYGARFSFSRSRKMKEIARKYGLKYSMYKLAIINFGPYRIKKNFIEGSLNGRDVLIYDLCPPTFCTDFLCSTIVIIDREERELSCLPLKPTSLEEIEMVLFNISEEHF